MSSKRILILAALLAWNLSLPAGAGLDELATQLQLQDECRTNADCRACQECRLVETLELPGREPILVHRCNYVCDAECESNLDCPSSQSCNVQGRCQVEPPCFGEGCPCRTDLDCSAFTEEDDRFFCQDGTCATRECNTDFDCALNFACDTGECVIDTELDRDRDGVPNAADNCPNMVNTDQDDLDHDGIGDLCDPDLDGDSFANAVDNCPQLSNALQGDRDGNSVGDACEADLDADGVLDDVDNCTIQMLTASPSNPDQLDSDGDGRGDRCDGDADGDGVLNLFDACPTAVALLCSTDSDGDGRADLEDTSPAPHVPTVPVRFTGRGQGNDAPVATGFSTKLDENLPSTALGFVLVSDSDRNDSHSFAITAGNDAGLFAIGPDSGEVSTKTELDFEAATQHGLTVEVTDVGGLSATAAVNVEVLNVNEPPELVGFVASINENQDPQLLFSVSGSDPDTLDELSYDISAGDPNGLFTIDKASGAVSTAGPLDFEAADEHILTATVSDAGGLFAHAEVKVLVRDVEEGGPPEPPAEGVLTFDFTGTALPLPVPGGIFAGQGTAVTGFFTYNTDMPDRSSNTAQIDTFVFDDEGMVKDFRIVVTLGDATVDSADNQNLPTIPHHRLEIVDGFVFTTSEGVELNEDRFTLTTLRRAAGDDTITLILRDAVLPPEEADAVLPGSGGLTGAVPTTAPNVASFNCESVPETAPPEANCSHSLVFVLDENDQLIGNMGFRIDSVTRRDP